MAVVCGGMHEADCMQPASTYKQLLLSHKRSHPYSVTMDSLATCTPQLCLIKVSNPLSMRKPCSSLATTDSSMDLVVSEGHINTVM